MTITCHRTEYLKLMKEPISTGLMRLLARHQICRTSRQHDVSKKGREPPSETRNSAGRKQSLDVISVGKSQHRGHLAGQRSRDGYMSNGLRVVQNSSVGDLARACGVSRSLGNLMDDVSTVYRTAGVQKLPLVRQETSSARAPPPRRADAPVPRQPSEVEADDAPGLVVKISEMIRRDASAALRTQVEVSREPVERLLA